MTFPDTSAPLFSLDQVSFHYEDGNLALDGLSLDIHAGETLALLGSNGCGKSTLLKLLDGLYFPNEGSIQFEGKQLTEDTFQDEKFNLNFRSRVGLVFQDSDVQLFLPTVLDELAFAPLQMDLSRREVEGRVTSALDALQIQQLRSRAPHQLSGGEKKKVALASLLTLAPDVWLFDEPTSGLDPRTTAWLTAFMNEQAAQGKTILLATHDLAITRQVAGRVCLLNEQHRLIYDGAPAGVLDNAELLRSANLI